MANLLSMAQTPLTIQDAAELLGVSDKTVRRMLDDSSLQEAGRDTRGRILITPESLEAALHSRRAKIPREEAREITPASNANTDVSLAAVGALTEMVRERDQRIYELTNEIGQLRAEQQVLTMQVEAAQARVRQVEGELATANEEITQLWAALSAPDELPDQLSNEAEGSILGKIRRRIGLG